MMSLVPETGYNVYLHLETFRAETISSTIYILYINRCLPKCSTLTMRPHRGLADVQTDARISTEMRHESVKYIIELVSNTDVLIIDIN